MGNNKDIDIRIIKKYLMTEKDKLLFPIVYISLYAAIMQAPFKVYYNI